MCPGVPPVSVTPEFPPIKFLHLDLDYSFGWLLSLCFAQAIFQPLSFIIETHRHDEAARHY